MQRIITSHFLSIYLANVNWPHDVKARPALIMSRTVNNFKVFRITSKFPTQKSRQIGKNYLVIEQWKLAGLNRPSCIDTTRLYLINSQYIMQRAPLGKLTALDIERLFQFLFDKRR